MTDGRAGSADAVDRFRQRFGTAPTVVVRGPGRVNVIGEHTDYSNLPVMPMAIQRSLTVAASPTDNGRITAHSTIFGDARVNVGVPDENADVEGWGRCLTAAAAEMPGAGGVDLLVAGDLPPESGLSSSAALITGVLAALE